MRQNSLDAYKEIRETKAINRRRVFEVIARRKAVTAQEIATELGWGINCVTPRICELRASKRIVEAGSVKNGNGFTVTLYSPIEAWGGVV